MKSDDDIFPKQTFHHREELTGSLSVGKHSVEGLQIIYQYALDRPSLITAKVVGTEEDASKIFQLSNYAEPYLHLNARSRYDSPYGNIIESKSVICRMITHKSEPPNSRYFVADLELDNVLKKELFSDPEFFDRPELSGDAPKRYLSFYIAGPRAAWNTYWTVERSFTGDSKIDVSESDLLLDVTSAYKIQIRPWFFWDEDYGNDKYNLQTSTLSIQFITDAEIDAFTDDEFVSSATATIEELLLLASFITRRRIMWFGYSLRSFGKLQTFRTSGREVQEEGITKDDLVVNPMKTVEFLNRTAGTMASLRRKEIDLKIPIEYYLNGNESNRSLEEEFTFYILALEKIKDMYAKAHNLGQILATDEFKTIRTSIETAIEQKVSDLVTRNGMKRKISELNRYSFRTLLERLVEDYGIDWSDLYPTPGERFSFIEMRDRLIHSAEPLESEELFRETNRLRYIVERVILKMLSWADFSFAPREYNRRWLAKR